MRPSLVHSLKAVANASKRSRKKCLACGSRLVQWDNFTDAGNLGDGFFCDFFCSHRWAVLAAKRESKL